MSTWTCAGDCGAFCISTDGSADGPPLGWWTISRRGSFAARHFCGLVCLLAFLARAWRAVLRGEAAG